MPLVQMQNSKQASWFKRKRIAIFAWLATFLALSALVGVRFLEFSLPGAAVGYLKVALTATGLTGGAAASAASVSIALCIVVLPVLLIFVGFTIWHQKLDSVRSCNRRRKASIKTSKIAVRAGQIASVLVPMIAVTMVVAGLAVPWPFLLALAALPLVVVLIVYPGISVREYLKARYSKKVGLITTKPSDRFSLDFQDIVLFAWFGFEEGFQSMLCDHLLAMVKGGQSVSMEMVDEFRLKVDRMTPEVTLLLLAAGMTAEMVNKRVGGIGLNLLGQMVKAKHPFKDGCAVPSESIQILLDHFTHNGICALDLEAEDSSLSNCGIVGVGRPLYWALYRNRPDVAKWLIEAGADLSFVSISKSSGGHPILRRPYARLQKLLAENPCLPPAGPIALDSVAELKGKGVSAADALVVLSAEQAIAVQDENPEIFAEIERLGAQDLSSQGGSPSQHGKFSRKPSSNADRGFTSHQPPV